MCGCSALMPHKQLSAQGTGNLGVMLKWKCRQNSGLGCCLGLIRPLILALHQIDHAPRIALHGEHQRSLSSVAPTSFSSVQSLSMPILQSLDGAQPGFKAAGSRERLVGVLW